MNLNFRSTNEMYANNVRKFLLGGPMGPAPEELGAPMPPEGAPEGAPAPEEGTPAPQGGEDLLGQVAQLLVDMLMQLIGDPNAVALILQMALEMIQQGGLGEPAPQEEPVYRLGGRLAYRIRK